VQNLSQYSARDVLAEALTRLRQLGISQAIVVQSDGGSDFISGMFQSYCSTIGQWVRSKVNQKGGMGILERLNRTFKYGFLFREECRTLDELCDICRRFEHWYNRERKHSSIGFRTPWQALLEPHPSPTARTASALKPRGSRFSPYPPVQG
jgi:putative transposase